MLFILSAFAALSFPFLIVSAWRTHPKSSLFLAVITLFILGFVTFSIQVKNLLDTYGTSDPQLMAHYIREFRRPYHIAVIFILPLLYAFQRFLLRHEKK